MKMNKFLLSGTIYAGIFLCTGMANAQVGINTTTPDSNAVLDIVSKEKGVLIPRVSLVTITSASPMSKHVAGMMVYNTADTTGTTTPSENGVSPGFYYNSGTKWIRVADYSKVDITNDAWLNSQTNGDTKVYLSTLSDGKTARPKETEFEIEDNGNVGIGTTEPTAKLHVSAKSSNNNYSTIANFLAPDNGTGKFSQISVGNTLSTDNTAELRFYNNAPGSISNRFDVGFYGTKSILSVVANGNVGVNNTAPSSTFDVDGTVEITTVNNVQTDTNYKPLVWNTNSKRVETTEDNYSVKRIVANVVNGASANISAPLTLTGVATAYEIKILVHNECSATAYNKFMVTGGLTYWRIGYIAGITQSGSSTGTNSNGTSITVKNTTSITCQDGSNTAALNYTVSISNSGQLSITNNGNIARSYTIIIDKIIN